MHKQMPRSLQLVLVLIAAAMVLNLLTGSFLVAVLQALLLFGAAKGNEAVRGLIIGLAWVGIVSSLVPVFRGFVEGETVLAVVSLFVAMVGAVANGYAIKTLQRWDVQQWMYQRSMGQ